MRGRTALSLAALAAVILVTACDVTPAAAARRGSAGRYRRADASPRASLILEGGLAQPLGDLGDNYLGTAKGFGAETGYDLGVRLRAVWPSGWALCPSFHYQDFGDFNDIDNAGDPYTVATSLTSYGLDLQHFWETPGSTLQPFVSAGLALHHNRYRDETHGNDPSFYETAANALAVVLGAGLKVDVFEISASYAVDRFETARLSTSGRRASYDWDTLSLRVGIELPVN